jgi:hypothetical protein
MRACDFDQFGRFGKTVDVRELLDGQTHLLTYNATRLVRQVVSSKRPNG